jgi:hypothetical protein
VARVSFVINGSCGRKRGCEVFTNDYTLAWDVPRSFPGYAWVPCVVSDHDQQVGKSPEKTTLALVPRDDAAFRTWYPLEESVALYRELADIDPTPEGILAFARRYGLLGPGAEIVADVPAAEGVRARARAEVDYLWGWRKNIALLYQTVSLWDMIQAGDAAGLSAVIEWHEGGIRCKFPPRAVEILGGRPGVPLYFKEDLAKCEPRLRRLPHGEVFGPATVAVLVNINEQIYLHNGPRLFWDPRRNTVVRQDLPASLHAAIWLQFAEAVAANKKSRRCRECGRWFDVAPGTARADKVVCSTACRSKGYRERQEQARRLHAAGKNFKEIARELGSDVPTVRGWVKGKKQR